MLPRTRIGSAGFYAIEMGSFVRVSIWICRVRKSEFEIVLGKFKENTRKGFRSGCIFGKQELASTEDIMKGNSFWIVQSCKTETNYCTCMFQDEDVSHVTSIR